MDTNSKLGPEVVQDDLHKQRKNGKILNGIIKIHAIVMTNSLKEKYVGKITRIQNTTVGVEERIIDFIMIG